MTPSPRPPLDLRSDLVREAIADPAARTWCLANLTRRQNNRISLRMLTVESRRAERRAA